MDYDKTSMPDAYDKARPLLDENRAVWSDALRSEVPTARHIVDIGCGTGRLSFSSRTSTPRMLPVSIRPKP